MSTTKGSAPVYIQVDGIWKKIGVGPNPEHMSGELTFEIFDETYVSYLLTALNTGRFKFSTT